VLVSLFAQTMSETIVIERDGEPTRDSAGSVKPGPPTHTTVGGCGIFYPFGVAGSSSEYHDAAETVVTRRILFAPLGTDIRPADRVIHGTDRYQVVGDPLTFPATSLAHVEAVLKEVTG
jgi:hypothetical protein